MFLEYLNVATMTFVAVIIKWYHQGLFDPQDLRNPGKEILKYLFWESTDNHLRQLNVQWQKTVKMRILLRTSGQKIELWNLGRIA